MLQVLQIVRAIRSWTHECGEEEDLEKTHGDASASLFRPPPPFPEKAGDVSADTQISRSVFPSPHFFRLGLPGRDVSTTLEAPSFPAFS